jgi:GntR family transcriptional regulator
VVSKVVPFVFKLNTDPESGGIEDDVYKLDVKEQGRVPEETIPRIEVQASAGLLTQQLKLPEGSQVISRHQQRRIDGTAWFMQTTFYPMDLVTKLGAIKLLMAENIREGMVKYLETLGIKQVGENGTPIRFTVTIYPTDRNQFQMEAGRVPSRTE